MTREQAKQTVYDKFRQTLKPDKSGKGYICPILDCKVVLVHMVQA